MNRFYRLPHCLSLSLPYQDYLNALLICSDSPHLTHPVKVNYKPTLLDDNANLRSWYYSGEDPIAFLIVF